MPKVIEHIQEKLLAEAKKQVMESGYSAMTIRSVAKACGVGVGTVYNYFPSKEMLTAGFMLEDWQQCLEVIRSCCQAFSAWPENIDDIDKILGGVYRELRKFIEKYASLFQDESAGAGFAAALPTRHIQLRGQIAEPLLPLCRIQNRVEPEFLSQFLAQNLLSWAMENCDSALVNSALLPLFHK